MGSENPVILAAALNNIPKARSMCIVIELIGSIGLILAVVIVIAVKKPLLTK